MKINTTLPILLGTSILGHGAMFYTIATDASGGFTEGGYTGTGGTVMPSAGGGAAGQTVIVNNFSSGTFDLGRTAVDFTGFALLSGQATSNAPTPLGASVTITMNGPGATADFASVRHVGILGKPVISDMQNVTSFDVEWTWDEPIAAPLGGTPIAFGPFLTGLANITSVPLTVDLELLGLAHTFDGVNAIPGLPANADSIDLAGTEAGNAWPTGSSTNTFELSTGGAWQGSMGFDLNGGAFTGVWPSGSQGDGVLQDVEMVYATGFKAHVEVTAGGAIPNGSQFIFSTNGNQWSDSVTAIENIPEPSAISLFGLGSLLFLARRHK